MSASDPKTDIALGVEEGNAPQKGGGLFPAVLTLANRRSAQSVSVLSSHRLFCCAADLMNEPIGRIEMNVAARCGFAASNYGHAFSGSPTKYRPKEYRITRVALRHIYRTFCNKD